MIPINATIRTITAAVISATFISGCATGSGGSQSTATAQAAENVAASNTCPPEANMLADTGFTTLAGGPKRVWGARQHSRGKDFVATAKDGTLTIEKTGHEPWFVMSQQIDRGFSAGTELQYDATMSFDTYEPKDRHGFGYLSGLHLVGKSGRRIVVRSMADHEPNLGEHLEQRLVTQVTIDTDINQIDVGFIHQAGGKFTVRKPRLINITRHPECRLP
jgi:hypothetical protein